MTDMLKPGVIPLSLLSLALFVISCGGDMSEQGQSTPGDTSSIVFVADSLLPESTSTTRRTADPRIILGAEASESLDSSADLYRDYQLVGLVTTRYEVKGATVFVEIAQCATGTDAYGLYALTRPHGIDTYHLGVEGYLLGNSLYFTQEQYVVTLSTFDETENGPDAMRLLAVTISARIGTAGAIPDQFGLFPDENRVLPSARYYRTGFPDIPGLEQVFTVSYLFGSDTLLLFLAEDKGGTKFLGVREYAGRTASRTSPATDFAFDDNYGLTFSDEKHGVVLAGLKNLILVGAIGYDASRNEALVRRWIDGMP